MFNKNQAFQIKCNVCNYSIIDGAGIFKSKHVEYTIIVTCSFKGWQISKRYTDFENLHMKLIKKLNQLPTFPSKRMSSVSTEVIRERMTCFEEYLNTLLSNYSVLQLPELAEFIDLDLDLVKEYINSINLKESKTMTGRKSISSNYGNTACNSKENVYSNLFQFKQYDLDNDKTANITVIEEFLRNLSEKRDQKSDIIKEFEVFLKDSAKWPFFALSEIYKLLNGINDRKNGSFYNGLLFHIGNVQNNQLGSQKCLEFSAKLFAYEFNPQCEDYMIVFRKTPVDHVLSMELETHITSKVSSDQFNAFNVLRAFLNDSKHLVRKTRRLLNNEEAEKLFFDWYDRESNMDSID